MATESPKEETTVKAPKQPLGDDIHTHIASQSAIRVGTCLTLLGLLRVVEGLKKVDTLGDEILALGAAGFLVSGMLAYFALRSKKSHSKYVAGWTADAVFLASHGLLIIICLVIAYELF